MRRSSTRASTRKGSLTIVGTGILLVAQTTLEAKTHIEESDRVFLLVTDPVTEAWIRSLNPRSQSLYGCYRDGRPRIEAYREMVRRILSPVLRGLDVCAVFYGHPGVFVQPSHEAIRRAREHGLEARMLPGISAEDCLFADLGVDPGAGCQSFEATDFLVRRRQFDPRVALVLWQVGVIGDRSFRKSGRYRREGLAVLQGRLEPMYPPRHTAILYEASQYPVCPPRIERLPLSDLAGARTTAISTLYVPRGGEAQADPKMLERLGIRATDVSMRRKLASSHAK